MDTKEAGRLGGKANAKKHDHAYYVSLGKKGMASKYKDKPKKK